MRVFPLNHRLTSAGEAIAGTAGQTLARWLVLENIQDQAATVSEVARRMGQARQGVQRLADLLAGEGLAAYEDNPRHRRASLLVVTPKGAEALHQIQAAQRRWAAEMESALGGPELERAGAFLDRVMELVAGHTGSTGSGGPESALRRSNDGHRLPRV